MKRINQFRVPSETEQKKHEVFAQGAYRAANT